MAAIDDKITKLETQLKQAKAQRQKVEARKRAATSKMTRQQDTRKKILVGAAILAKVERGEWPKDKLLAMLETTLTRADDRALFDLQAPATEPAFLDDVDPDTVDIPKLVTLPRS